MSTSTLAYRQKHRPKPKPVKPLPPVPPNLTPADLEAIREIVNAIREMSEWQPIETAPKDGTRILAYWPNFGVDLIRRHDPGGEARNPRHHYESWVRAGDGAYLGGKPTHWMPLPEPPK